MSGAVDLPPLEQPPQPLWDLLTGTDAPSRAFRQGIRQYNSAFNMASSTAKVERRFPSGVQAFRINGVVHHTGECLHTALSFCGFFALCTRPTWCQWIEMTSGRSSILLCFLLNWRIYDTCFQFLSPFLRPVFQEDN